MNVSVYENIEIYLAILLKLSHLLITFQIYLHLKTAKIQDS